MVEKKRQLIICGDMNATAEYCKSFVGGSNCTHSGANDNGERFATFLSTEELALSNTWFQHKKIHKDTWYSNTGTFSKGGLTLSDIPKTIAKTNLLHLFLDIVLVVLGNCFMHTNEDAIS